MKKAIAILVACVLIMGGAVAFAGTMQEETEKAGGALTKFGQDLYDLVFVRIPETFTKDLSATGTKQKAGEGSTGSTQKMESKKYVK